MVFQETKNKIDKSKNTNECKNGEQMDNEAWACCNLDWHFLSFYIIINCIIINNKLPSKGRKAVLVPNFHHYYHHPDAYSEHCQTNKLWILATVMKGL